MVLGMVIAVTAAAFEMPVCETPGAVATMGTGSLLGDPKVRAAAQKGLTFLETSATAWASGHACYGCHVHAVTVEALSVGEANGYDVNEKTLRTFIEAMTTGPGGERNGEIGLRYAHGDTLRAASNGFGGAAFARYDALVGDAVRGDLLSVSRRLLTYQAEDGAITDPEGWVNAPVGTGRVQLTAQAVSTWRQAYERTADPAWLSAIARAETWFQGQVTALDPTTADLQHMNYALLGLLASGGTPSEGAVAALISGIGARQNEDGGFSLQLGGASDGFATGETLYTLRRLGLTDADPALSRGTNWLVSHQTPQGGWRSGGFEKAEAMWAVLGLVSVDVLTLNVTGVQDGQHVEGDVSLEALATSNRGRGVKDVRLFVDDKPLDGACGGKLASVWHTSSIASGRHVLEVRATDADGQVARRRLEVYTGDWWLTRLATRWDDGGSVVSVRNLAPAGRGGKVKVEILRGETVVWTDTRDARPGANTFWWDGKEQLGQRLMARVTFVSSAGVAGQQLETSFVHGDPAAVAKNFGEIAGSVALGGGMSAVNTEVQLIDFDGNVVQSATTTDEGNYRFKGVDAAKYKLRVVKQGFKAEDMDVEAEAGEEAAPAPIATVEE